MNALDAIKNRTSYRGRYKDLPVPKDDLLKILEAGVSAPSGCNKQTTSFIAVDDIKLLRLYKGSDRGYAPYFAPFTFGVYTENNKIYVNTRGSWQVEYTDIMGFQLLFPKLTQNEAEKFNIASEKDWGSYFDYKLFKDYIIKNTSAFCFMMNGNEKKTSIRIGGEVKKVLSSFYYIKKNDLIVV